MSFEILNKIWCWLQKCLIPFTPECLEKRTFKVGYDNGVTGGSSDNSCGARGNFVRFDWTFTVSEWWVNGVNVASDEALGPFADWSAQLQGWADYFNSVDTNPNSNAEFGFNPAPTWRYAEITGCDPNAEYGKLVLTRDDGCIFTVYPILESDVIERASKYATLDHDGNKVISWCDADGVALAEPPTSPECFVPCGYPFGPYIANDAVSACVTEIRDNACDKLEDGTLVPFIQVVLFCNGSELSKENYTLDSWFNAADPDELVEYEIVGTVVNCLTGEEFTDPVDKDINWSLQAGYICDENDSRFGEAVCWVQGVDTAGNVIFPNGSDCPEYLPAKYDGRVTLNGVCETLSLAGAVQNANDTDSFQSSGGGTNTHSIQFTQDTNIGQFIASQINDAINGVPILFTVCNVSIEGQVIFSYDPRTTSITGGSVGTGSISFESSPQNDVVGCEGEYAALWDAQSDTPTTNPNNVTTSCTRLTFVEAGDPIQPDCTKPLDPQPTQVSKGNLQNTPDIYTPVYRCFEQTVAGSDVEVQSGASDCDPADAEIGDTVCGTYRVSVGCAVTSVVSVGTDNPDITFGPAAIANGSVVTGEYCWVWDGNTIPNDPITLVVETECGQLTVTGDDFFICSGGNSNSILTGADSVVKLSICEFKTLGKPSVFQDSTGVVIGVSELTPCDTDISVTGGSGIPTTKCEAVTGCEVASSVPTALISSGFQMQLESGTNGVNHWIRITNNSFGLGNEEETGAARLISTCMANRGFVEGSIADSQGNTFPVAFSVSDVVTYTQTPHPVFTDQYSEVYLETAPPSKDCNGEFQEYWDLHEAGLIAPANAPDTTTLRLNCFIIKDIVEEVDVGHVVGCLDQKILDALLVNNTLLQSINRIKMDSVCVTVNGTPQYVTPFIDPSGGLATLYFDRMGAIVAGEVLSADPCDCPCINCANNVRACTNLLAFDFDRGLVEAGEVTAYRVLDNGTQMFVTAHDYTTTSDGTNVSTYYDPIVAAVNALPDWSMVVDTEVPQTAQGKVNWKIEYSGSGAGELRIDRSGSIATLGNGDSYIIRVDAAGNMTTSVIDGGAAGETPDFNSPVYSACA